MKIQFIVKSLFFSLFVTVLFFFGLLQVETWIGTKTVPEVILSSNEDSPIHYQIQENQFLPATYAKIQAEKELWMLNPDGTVSVLNNTPSGSSSIELTTHF